MRINSIGTLLKTNFILKNKASKNKYTNKSKEKWNNRLKLYLSKKKSSSQLYKRNYKKTKKQEKISNNKKKSKKSKWKRKSDNNKPNV